MASNLTGLSVWDFLKVKIGGLFALNSGAAKEVTYQADEATGETAIAIGGETVQRRAATQHRIAAENTLGTDKIVNGDCETFTAGKVTGWDEYDPAGLMTLSEETLDVYAGSKSQKITVAAGSTYSALTTNFMTLTKGKLYVASVAVKVLSGKLKCWLNNTTSTVYLYSFGELTPADWTVYTAVFRCNETRSDYVFRFDTAITAGSALIDAVSVKEIISGTLELADNLRVGGAIIAAEGIGTEATVAARADITSGVSGAVRGVLRANRGAGTTTPGVVICEARDGSVYYQWRTAAGRLRVSSALPTSDTDGSDGIDIEDTLDVGGAATIGGNLSVAGAATVGGNLTATGNVSGANGNLAGDVSVGGALTVTGAVTAGSLSAGATGNVSGNNGSFLGTLDAGGAITTDSNITAQGDVAAQGGEMYAGNFGLTRGRLVAYHGPSGNTPGVCVLYTMAGIAKYLFVGLGGYLRVHTTLPTLYTDGIQVGAKLPEGDLEVGEALTQEGTIHIHGDGSTKGGVFELVSKNGTSYYFWVTDAGVMRRHTAYPTNWDTDGAVVGPGI